MRPQARPPLLSTPSLAALLICSTWPHLTFLPPRLTPSPGSRLIHPHLTPSRLAPRHLSPGPSLSSSSSSLRKLKLSRACSTVMLRLEARLRVRPCLCWGWEGSQRPCHCLAGRPPRAATAQPGPPHHEQTLQPDHLLLQALQLWELATIVIQGSHQGPKGLLQPPVSSSSCCSWNWGLGSRGQANV